MDRPESPTTAETVASTSFGGGSAAGVLLGRGGMGEVYRATSLKPGQSAALRFLT